MIINHSSKLNLTMNEPLEIPHVGISIVSKKGQRVIGAAVYKQQERAVADTMEEKALTMHIQLFEFYDNDQYSNLDCFMNQIGSAEIYLPEDFDDRARGDAKKVHSITSCKGLDVHYKKRGSFSKKNDTMDNLLQLVGKTSHTTNSVETEMPVALGCVEMLIQTLRLMHLAAGVNIGEDDEEDQSAGSGTGSIRFELSYGSLDHCMRLDSAAAEAVNLLPKADHPSQYGSLYGILNRCRTRMGSRLLDRWLRQPLLDSTEISNRQEVVQAFFESTLHRNEIRDGPLKAVPDLDAVINRMRKPGAGLEEIFRLYLFVRSIPALTNTIETLIGSLQQQQQSTQDGSATTGTAGPDTGSNTGTAGGISPSQARARLLEDRFLLPLQSIAEKFSLYEQLVEHVVDLSQLPDLKINPEHDAELQEKAHEQEELLSQAERILQEARTTWASFADVKLEQNPQHGFILRTTRGDDERQLRQNSSSVQILSILKNGVHFTTPQLVRIADRYLGIQSEYAEQQRALVAQALETARTYLPVVEAVANLIAEIDVLVAFATTAALSPGVYVRPLVHPRVEGATGSIHLRGARHPCVELMDAMDQFIANDYDLLAEKSTFQIVTGPNMGGKSTYIRAVGCIAVLAQIGMFVPCDDAEMTVVDCVLARVGAGDAVQKGVSTFMAEMLESSVMLQTATRDSLIIIDELGRGTSTFDGFGLAWSISDYIVRQLQCKCLFATHFHELTALQKQYPQAVTNKHVQAHIDETQNNQVVMLYQLGSGPCTKSFGIHVAATADFPASVIRCAKRKSISLEKPEGVPINDSEHENEIEDACDGERFVKLPRAEAMRDTLTAFAAAAAAAAATVGGVGVTASASVTATEGDTTSSGRKYFDRLNFIKSVRDVCSTHLTVTV